MAKYGCPRECISMVQHFHDGMHADTSLEQWRNILAIPNNQWCQTRLCSNTIQSIVLHHADWCFQRRREWCQHQVPYRTIKSRRLQANSKVITDTVGDFLCADDCALNACSEADMQCSVEKFCSSRFCLGFTISTKKDEVLYQPALVKPYIESNITGNVHKCNELNRLT